MPEAPPPPGAMRPGATTPCAPQAGSRPAAGPPSWLDETTFALMREATSGDGSAVDAAARARDVAAARYPALPATLLTEAAWLALASTGRDSPQGDGR